MRATPPPGAGRVRRIKTGKFDRGGIHVVVDACATWSASPGSRTHRRSSRSSGRRRRAPVRSMACGWTLIAAKPYGGGLGRCIGQLRGPAARRLLDAGEPVLKPSAATSWDEDAKLDCSTRCRSLLHSLALGCQWLSSARCDVRWKAAVFVESDETTVSGGSFSSRYAFRRPLLQIGGANIAARGSRASSSPTSSSLADDKACPLSLLLSTARRDPSLIAPLAVRWLSMAQLQLAAMFARKTAVFVEPERNDCLRRICSPLTRFTSAPPAEIGGAEHRAAARIAAFAARLLRRPQTIKRVCSLRLSTARARSVFDCSARCSLGVTGLCNSTLAAMFAGRPHRVFVANPSETTVSRRISSPLARVSSAALPAESAARTIAAARIAPPEARLLRRRTQTIRV